MTDHTQAPSKDQLAEQQIRFLLADAKFSIERGRALDSQLVSAWALEQLCEAALAQRAAHEPPATPLSDAAIICIANQYDQGPSATYEFDKTTLLRMMRSFAATVEGMVLDGATSPPPVCPTCRGNDREMPCAYPSEGKPGCLRAASPPTACHFMTPTSFHCAKGDVHEYTGSGVCGVKPSPTKGEAQSGGDPIPLKSILDEEVECTENACGWEGIVDECIPDVDGSGELGCPLCMAYVRATPGEIGE